jgi:DNA polymerase
MPDVNDLAELRDLVASTRALLEFHRDAGSFGLPIGVASDLPEAPAFASLAESSQVRPPHAPHAARSHERPAPETAAQAASFALTPPDTRGSRVTGGLPVRVPGIEVPSDPAARLTRLNVMRDEVIACTSCELHKARKQTVFSRGNPSAELVFIGEGPGADEDAQGEPFVGAAGQLLDRMIRAMGFERDDVYICNVVKCRPPKNRTPEPEEMDACSGYMHEQIALVGPKVMVALGATAIKGLLGTSMGITRMRGSWKLYRASIPVMPTFHPAYLLRNPDAKRDVWEDLKAVVRKLGREPRAT